MDGIERARGPHYGAVRGRNYDDCVLCWSYSTGSNQCSESERFSSPFHSSNECNGVMDRALTS